MTRKVEPTVTVLTLSSILASARWLGLAEFVSRTAALLTGLLIARHLAPAEYGLLASATVAGGLVASLCDLGLNKIVLREVPRDPENPGTLVVHAAAARTIASIPTVAISVSVGQLLFPEVGWIALLVAVAYSCISSIDDLIHHALLGAGKPRATAISRGLSRSAGLLLISLAIASGATWSALLLTHLLVSLLSVATTSFVFVHTCSSLPIHHLSRLGLGRLVRKGLPVWLSSILVTLYFRGDVLLLEKLRGPHEAGPYAVVEGLVLSASTLAYVLNTVILPRLAEGRARQISLAGGEERYLLLLTSMTTAASVIICLGAPWLVVVLLGPQYDSAVSSLQVLSWWLPISAVTGFLGAVSIAEQQETCMLKAAVANAAANIAANLVLITLLGATGAAAAFLVGEVTGAAVYCLQLRRIQARPESIAQAGVVMLAGVFLSFLLLPATADWTSGLGHGLRRSLR